MTRGKIRNISYRIHKRFQKLVQCDIWLDIKYAEKEEEEMYNQTTLSLQLRQTFLTLFSLTALLMFNKKKTRQCKLLVCDTISPSFRITADKRRFDIRRIFLKNKLLY